MGGRRAYPQGVPFSMSYPEVPLYALLENSARKFPHRDAVIFYGRRITYGELWSEAKSLAASFRGLGVGEGDRVGLLLPNVPQFLIAYNAVLAVGGIVVPVNPLNPVEEVGRELRETEVGAIIVLDRLIDRLPEERPRNTVVAEAAAYAPRSLKLLSRLRGRVSRRLEGAISFERLVEGPPLEELADVNPREDTAVVLYTSGTTGRPRGVMLTHYGLVANALQSYHWLRGWGFSAKPQPAGWPVVVCAVPFFHAYGMTVGMNEAIQFGCTLVLVPEPSAERILDAIQRHRATHLPAIPRFIEEILDHPNRGRYDLSSLTSCLSGGAPIDPRLAGRFVEATGASLYQGYGLTEAGPCTHCTPVGGGPDRRSAGLAFPDTEARIVDQQLGEVEMPPGDVGELVVRGPQIMKGYWRDPEETARVLRGGWLYTGDTAYVDGEGYLYVVGRKRDRIVVGGHSVWPSEVEDVLASNPKVEVAVAVGVPDPLKCSTDIRALVTLRAGVEREGAEAELLDYCRGRLEYFQVPASVKVVDSIPMTPMGKVDRLAVEAEIERLVNERMDRGG